MYHLYFGLTEPAFSIAVNPKYLYMSEQHKEALAHLVYGVQGGGFVLLSGEVGTGKTTIVRCLLQQLPSDTEVAFVLNPMADVASLLLVICEELEIKIYQDEQPSVKELMESVQVRLLENHAKGKRTVLLIDEAQLLSADVLEQIRLLTNLETETEKLMQIVLVGQPEINDILAQPRLRQLTQRITARFHIDALSLQETENYIAHRLKVAGKHDDRIIFPKTIIKKIHKFSNGVPRLINVLCERLLVGAYGHSKYEVDSAIFTRAIAEVGGLKKQPRLPLLPINGVTASLAAAFLACVLLLTLFLNLSESEKPEKAEIQVPIANKLSTDNPDNRAHILNSSTAYSVFFKHHDIRYGEERHPCWQTEQHNMTCVKEKLETWQELISINRPVILTLVTKEKDLRYAVLVGERGDDVYGLDKNGSRIRLNKSEIASAWNGSATFIWRKPETYKRPLAIGASSPIIQQVAEQFALIDGQSQPITNRQFTKTLETRIKIFQASVGLEADGIIGEHTIMKLNERVGLAKTLNDYEN